MYLSPRLSLCLAGVEKGVRFVAVVVNHDERSRQLQLHRGTKRGSAREDRKQEGEEEEDTVKAGTVRQQHHFSQGKATEEEAVSQYVRTQEEE